MTKRRRKRQPLRAWHFIAGAAGLSVAIVSGFFVATGVNRTRPVRSVHAELPGIALDGLDAAQVQDVLVASRRESCPCGCGFTLAECRVKDPTCPRSGAILAKMVDRLRRLSSDASRTK
jgi:hypothetical protein